MQLITQSSVNYREGLYEFISQYRENIEFKTNYRPVISLNYQQLYEKAVAMILQSANFNLKDVMTLYSEIPAVVAEDDRLRVKRFLAPAGEISLNDNRQVLDTG